MALQTYLANLITAIGTDYKTLRTWMFGSSVGTLAGLTTDDKTSLVAAINETKAGNSGSPPSATDTVAGVVELADSAEHLAGVDATRAATPAGVKAVVDAVIDSAPGALDTLNELSAALGDDADFAGTMTAALAGKQNADADLTAIAALVSAANKVPYATGAGTWALGDFTAAGRALVGAADAAAQRSALSVYSQAELGDPETDLAALYAAAKA